LFISLRRFWEQDGEKSAEALLRFGELVLEALALHAVEVDAADYEYFQQEVRRRRDELSERPPPEEILQIAGAVSRAIEDYNHRTARAIRIFNIELHNMVGMLTDTVSHIAASGSSSVSKLQNIEKQIERASMIEDIQKLKQQLGSCLESIREEAKSRKDDSAALVARISQEIERSRENRAALGLPALDPTGLPDRSELVEAIRSCLQERAPFHLAVLVLERCRAVMTRYGAGIVDEMRLQLSEHVAKQLGEQDRIYRWGSTSFVVLIRKDAPRDVIRVEIARIAGSRLERTFQVGGRTVMLPISIAWSVFAPQTSDTHSLLEQIDKFVRGVDSLA
jgi:GGDEF domain-containing protein